MNKIHLFILLLLLNVNAILAINIDGYCCLEWQTNHEGSKVLFIADSPTAVTDSVFTDMNGYYSIEVEPGLYDIEYSHNDYYPDYLYGQFLTQSTTLPDIYLAPNHPGILLSGEIRGVLEDTVYYIVDHTEVDDSDSLIINPGAEIYFCGEFMFNINGYLYAVGTEEDSILFAKISGGEPHEGIRIDNSANSTSTMKYCIINGSGVGGLYVSNFSLIEKCFFTGNQSSGLRVSSNSPTIRKCTMRWNSGTNGGGIRVTNDSSPLIEYCTIIENEAWEHGGGIYCDDSSQLILKNCLVASNGPKGGICADWSANPTVINCTIVDNWSYTNESGGLVLRMDSHTTIKNSIIHGNNYGIYFMSNATTDIEYCEFSGNLYGPTGGTGQGPPPFFGLLNFINYNSDPCDLYQNIFLDPLFTAPHNGDLTLTSASPCIDAGDPLSRPDPDSTIADLGAYYFDQSLSVPIVTISVSGDNIVLIWEELPFAVSYNIYRSDTPYFSISGMTPIATVDLPTFTDNGAVLEGSYFYVVTGEE